VGVWQRRPALVVSVGAHRAGSFVNAATSPRSMVKILSRRFFDLGFRALRKAMRAFRGSPKARTLRVFPPTRDRLELGDLVNRLAWYVPNPATRIQVPCAPAVLAESANLSSLAVPRGQSRQFEKLPENVALVPARRVPEPEADLILLRRWRSLWRVALDLNRVAMIDAEFYSTEESTTWATLHDSGLSAQERSDLESASKGNFANLLESLAGAKRAYVFTTGPSLDRATSFTYEPSSLRIVCNSIVKNRSLLEYIRPQVLVFADPVFHFSPCVYANEFRRHALEMIRQHDCYCMVPETQASLLLAHYPGLGGRLIGMPVWPARVWNFPTTQRFFVAETANIMTLFMLPLASTVAREVYVIGADGRQKGETYFWRHSAQNQFDELMQTVVETHPSFFRDRVYTDYYAEHCRVVASQIAFGEARGCTYNSLTPSYIPALAARHVPDGEGEAACGLA